MATSLRRRDSGPQVKKVQEALKKLGYHVKADGHFGPETDKAVRQFQRKKCLWPDSIVGPKTLKYLTGSVPKSKSAPPSDLVMALGQGIYPAMHAASSFVPSFSYHASQIRLSYDGLRFIYKHETLAGVSERLHWPKGASGVTLGPGYDMKLRSKTEIVHDLTAIGVDLSTAQKVSEGYHKTGADADTFAKNNNHLVALTPGQQMALLRNKAPDYEAKVRNNITIHLCQFEYDALVSFVYNPGGKFWPVAHPINTGKVRDAMAVIKSRVGSGGSILPALVNRRNDEVALYLYGQYGSLNAYYNDGAHLPG